MYEYLHIDEWGKNNGQRLSQVPCSYCEKCDLFFNDRSTKDVELHYDCYILNTHM